MEENEQLDDFEDFFDTPGRSIDDTAISAVKSEQGRDSKWIANQSAKDQNRNNSAAPTVSRSNVSSDHDAYSPDYSSDSVTDSDSDTGTDSRKRKKERSRSRSASSRSGGSVSSERSYSSDESKDSRSRSSRKNKPTKKSRSRSESSYSSDSRTATPDSSAQKRKSEGRRKRRDSYSSVTSSSTYSGRKDKRKRTPSPQPKQAARRQAWNTEENQPNKRPDRPKTAKRRSSDDKSTRRREYNGKAHTDTDSDMTDVSPIASPRNGSVNGHGKESSEKRVVSMSKPPIYQAMPLGVEDSEGSNIQDPNALDLNILMKAVSELEKQKRVKSNTRRVMFEPLRARPTEKSNYTFNNDDTHRIEQENKRLLQQIMQQVQTSASGRKLQTAKDLKVKQSTLTTSAINRRRDQHRIENENLAFLRRLQKVRPSRGLSRNEQLHSYNATVLHGIPIATLHTAGSTGLQSGRQSSASSVAGSLGRTRSMTSIHSAATASSFGTASRQSSRAGSRPSSAKKSHRERPPWNDRW